MILAVVDDGWLREVAVLQTATDAYIVTCINTI